jgi:hypothetical protein
MLKIALTFHLERKFHQKLLTDQQLQKEIQFNYGNSINAI